jgi:glycosyltransferase involved in cell wall biosynthesis
LGFLVCTGDPSVTDLAVIILTKNEERHIERAIRSIREIASQIFVVDSFSMDNTVAIAEANGACVLRHEFVNHARQIQWAIDNAPITAGWVMRLDADELVESDLAVEIEQRLPQLGVDVVGINLRRKHIFMGRWVRHGGRYPLLLLRIWRRGYGRIEDRWMDEHMVVKGGRTVTFMGGFADFNLNDLTFFSEKHNRYATLEAIEVINQRLGLFDRAQGISVKDTWGQASARRVVKESLYNRLPFTIGSFLYFLWRYVFRLGFLDGRTGLVYHFLQGWWYRFLVGAKVMEMERAISHLSEKEDIVKELSRLTGLKILENEVR